MKRLVAAVPNGWGAAPAPTWQTFPTNVIEVDGVPFFAAYVPDNSPLTDADWATVVNAASPDRSSKNADTIATRLEDRLVDLQAIIDRPNVTLADNNTATIRQALRDIQVDVKTLARVDRQQTRKLLGLLDGTD